MGSEDVLKLKLLSARIPSAKKTLFTFVIFGDSRPSSSLEKFISRRVDHLRPRAIEKISGPSPVFIVNTGGGAPLRERRDQDERPYQDKYEKEEPRGVHFCLLTVWPDKIEFKTLHLDPDKLTWQAGDFLEVILSEGKK